MRTRNTPLTFDIELELLKNMKSIQQKSNSNSLSEVIRSAVDIFNYNNFKHEVSKHKQISVRLPADVKKKLCELSRKNKVSVGELLRVAIERLCALSSNPKTKESVMAVKKTVKKAPAKKKAVKKVVKKAVKKAPAKKKAVAKKAPAKKKAVAKKAPAKKKAVAKKAPAKKKVAAKKK